MIIGDDAHEMGETDELGGFESNALPSDLSLRLSDLYRQAMNDAQEWHDAHFLDAPDPVRRHRDHMAYFNDVLADTLAHCIALFGDQVVACMDTMRCERGIPSYRQQMCGLGARTPMPGWRKGLRYIRRYQRIGRLYPLELSSTEFDEEGLD